jgi:hypothetical protein
MNKKKIKEIFVGWGNKILDDIDLLPEEIKVKYNTEEKILICHECPVRTDDKCDSEKVGRVVVDFKYYDVKRKENDIVNGCGCNLSAKVISSSPCPLGKFEKFNEKK